MKLYNQIKQLLEKHLFSETAEIVINQCKEIVNAHAIGFAVWCVNLSNNNKL